jgi:hypothetical protein
MAKFSKSPKFDPYDFPFGANVKKPKDHTKKTTKGSGRGRKPRGGGS